VKAPRDRARTMVAVAACVAFTALLPSCRGPGAGSRSVDLGEHAAGSLTLAELAGASGLDLDGGRLYTVFDQTGIATRGSGAAGRILVAWAVPDDTAAWTPIALDLRAGAGCDALASASEPAVDLEAIDVDGDRFVVSTDGGFVIQGMRTGGELVASACYRCPAPAEACHFESVAYDGPDRILAVAEDSSACREADRAEGSDTGDSRDCYRAFVLAPGAGFQDRRTIAIARPEICVAGGSPLRLSDVTRMRGGLLFVGSCRMRNAARTSEGLADGEKYEYFLVAVSRDGSRSASQRITSDNVPVTHGLRPNLEGITAGDCTPRAWTISDNWYTSRQGDTVVERFEVEPELLAVLGCSP
jgi:hypothetical protein